MPPHTDMLQWEHVRPAELKLRRPLAARALKSREDA